MTASLRRQLRKSKPSYKAGAGVFECDGGGPVNDADYRYR